MPEKLSFAAILTIALLSLTWNAFPENSGNFYIQNYSPSEYRARYQNWDITQDNNGIMYIANGYGILEFDGRNFQLHSLEDRPVIRSLDAFSDNRIAVGSQNEFGLFIPASEGGPEFKSLKLLLPDNLQNIADVWETHVVNDIAYYETDEYLLIFKNDSLYNWKPENDKAYRSFKAHGRIMVWIEDTGLFYLNEDLSVELVNGGEYFDFDYNDRIISISEAENNSIIVYSLDNGFYTHNLNTGDLREIKNPAFEKIEKHVVYNFIYLGNSRVAIATLVGGIYVFDLHNNEIITVINKDTGLKSEIVKKLFLDEAGLLWAALEVGFANIDINSPLSYFDERNGIEGAIFSIIEFNNRIYAGTSNGVFVLEGNKFIKNEKLSLETWSFCSFYEDNTDHEHLLLSNTYGLLRLENNNIVKLTDEITFVTHPVKEHPNMLLAGLKEGIALYEFHDKQIINTYKPENIFQEIRNITYDGKGYWLGTFYEGLMYLQPGNEPSDFSIKTYTTDDGLPGMRRLTVMMADTIPLILTYNGMFRFDYNNQRFYRDTILTKNWENNNTAISYGNFIDNENVFLVFVDDNQVPSLQRFVFKNNELLPAYEPFSKRIESSDFNYISLTKNNIKWIGTPEKLARYDKSIQKDYKPEYSAIIRNVILADTIISSGISPKLHKQNDNTHLLTIPFKKNNITFQFEAPFYEKPKSTVFSTFLEGLDDDWTPWQSFNQKEYNNLREGNYTFKVKAKNIYGNISRQASYSFTVSAPWYRTVYAYSGGGVITLLIVLSIIRLSTYRLRQSKIRLERIVTERTAEITQQKEEITTQRDEIERQSDIVLSQNTQLEDYFSRITDSIKYAQQIQDAFLPEMNSLPDFIESSFILYKPKEIVSGDFFWYNKTGEDKMLFAMSDCTGHGVPGGFMSIFGISSLKDISSTNSREKANRILDKLRENTITTLQKMNSEAIQREGMDMVLMNITRKPGSKNRKATYDIEYAGALQPFYTLSFNEKNETLLTKHEVDKFPVGYSKKMKPFTLRQITLKPGDIIYLLSDGYIHQLNEEGEKLFSSKRFKSLLSRISRLPMNEQKAILEEEFYKWKGNEEQLDDISVIGLKLA